MKNLILLIFLLVTNYTLFGQSEKTLSIIKKKVSKTVTFIPSPKNFVENRRESIFKK